MMIVNAELTSHPAANILPQMNRADFEALKADIVTNGLREKIVIYNGQILDGRHRYRACLEAGIEPTFQQYEGDDPVAVVLSMNLHRRHLSSSQRAMIAADLATLKRGGDRSKAQNCALTHAQVAEQLGVSERQVDKGSALLKAEASGRAAPELVEQVHNGKISLSKAEKLVHLPPEQQRKVVAQNDSGTNVRPGKREQSQSWARRFEEMASQAERICARMADLIARAEKEGELTPELRELLVEACRNAPRWLFVETARPEDPAPDSLMPFEDA
jgi:ParB-like chromosome segregation protein Spo0J